MLTKFEIKYFKLQELMNRISESQFEKHGVRMLKVRDALLKRKQDG